MQHECMNEYIDENPKLISEPDFNDFFLQDMIILFPCCEMMEEIIDLFHILFFPKRSENPDEQNESDEQNEQKIFPSTQTIENSLSPKPFVTQRLGVVSAY